MNYQIACNCGHKGNQHADLYSRGIDSCPVIGACCVLGCDCKGYSSIPEVEVEPESTNAIEKGFEAMREKSVFMQIDKSVEGEDVHEFNEVKMKSSLICLECDIEKPESFFPSQRSNLQICLECCRMNEADKIIEAGGGIQDVRSYKENHKPNGLVMGPLMQSIAPVKSASPAEVKQSCLVFISGGYKSAIVAALAVKKFGEENVKGVYLKGTFKNKFLDEQQRLDAHFVCESLNIEFSSVQLIETEVTDEPEEVDLISLFECALKETDFTYAAMGFARDDLASQYVEQGFFDPIETFPFAPLLKLKPSGIIKQLFSSPLAIRAVCTSSNCTSTRGVIHCGQCKGCLSRAKAFAEFNSLAHNGPYSDPGLTGITEDLKSKLLKGGFKYVGSAEKSNSQSG